MILNKGGKIISKKSIVIICIISVILVFLSLGEHNNETLNVTLTKIGLKISNDERIEKGDREKSTIGISSMFDYRIVTTYAPNYVGLLAYSSIIGILVFTFDRKVV